MSRCSKERFNKLFSEINRIADDIKDHYDSQTMFNCIYVDKDSYDYFVGLFNDLTKV